LPPASASAITELFNDRHTSQQPDAERGQAEVKDVTRLSFRAASVMKTNRRHCDVLCDASAVLCPPNLLTYLLTYLVKLCVTCRFLISLIQTTNFT